MHKCSFFDFKMPIICQR